MLRVMLCAALCVAFGSLSTASAQAPASCSSAAASAAFNAGRSAGKSLVRQAANGPNFSCGTLDLFQSAVESALARAIQSTSRPNRATAECRYTGWLQGAEAELENVQATCADTCFLDGQFMGELAAVAYCELSILLGGLGLADLFVRAPVEVCGLAFETACDTTFVIKAVAFAGCRPYTQSSFVQVFEQTQNNQCAYDPVDPEDPNT